MDLIRGHTDTIILNVLRQGDSYGYEIYKKTFASVTTGMN